MPTAGILDRKGLYRSHFFGATPNELKIDRELFWNISKLLAKEILEGDPPGSHKPRGAPPELVVPLVGLQGPSSGI